MNRNALLPGGVATLAVMLAVGTAAAQPRPVQYPEPEPGVTPPAAAPEAPQPVARKAGGNRAHITLKVPEGAEVWFDGKKTTSTGAIREFRSPGLEPGYRYSYDVRVRWRQGDQEMTQRRQVVVSAGADVAEDFLPPPPRTAGTASVTVTPMPAPIQRNPVTPTPVR